MSEIRVDTISEKTSGSGVTIDGVLIKDTTIDVNGTAGALILDTDADTKIQASTDDNIEFFTAGKKQFNLTSFGSVQAFRDSATTFGPSFNGQHQRGTIASPTIVSSGDRIAEYKSSVYDGTAYLDGPRISFRVDGTPGDDDMPTRMEFQVGANGTASLYAAMTLHNDGSLIMNPIAGAITVFNENSVDSDFRVESNGNANMLFVDGGNDRVGVGTNAPARTVQIVDSSATPYLSIVGPNDAAAGIMLGDTDDETVGRITYDNSVNNLQLWTNDAEQVRIHSNGVLSASDGIALGVGTANTASNVLDDYEEGTWTVPNGAVNGITYAVASVAGNTYTKIGRQVTINAQVTFGGHTADGNATYLGTLPFTPLSGGVFVGKVQSTADITGCCVEINGGESFIRLMKDSGGTYDYVSRAESANQTFAFTISYLV